MIGNDDDDNDDVDVDVNVDEYNDIGSDADENDNREEEEDDDDEDYYDQDEEEVLAQQKKRITNTPTRKSNTTPQLKVSSSGSRKAKHKDNDTPGTGTDSKDIVDLTVGTETDTEYGTKSKPERSKLAITPSTPKPTTKSSTKRITDNTTSTKKRRRTTRSNHKSNIYQLDGYDIVISQRIIDAAVDKATAHANISTGGSASSNHHQNDPNVHEFSLLLQLDSNGISGSGTTDGVKQSNLPNPYPISSGNVIGRLEVPSMNDNKKSHYTNDATASTTTANSSTSTTSNMSQIKLDLHGIEYIGQVYPGPTMMVLSIRQESNDDPNEVDALILNTTTGNDTFHDQNIPNKKTSPRAPKSVLVLEHITNEFCNMIPIPSTNRGTSNNRSSFTMNATNYFQYNDDIDVNKNNVNSTNPTNNTTTTNSTTIMLDKDSNSILRHASIDDRSNTKRKAIPSKKKKK
jgi:hypothetical protein